MLVYKQRSQLPSPHKDPEDNARKPTLEGTIALTSPSGTRLENKDDAAPGDESEPVDAEFRPVPTEKDLCATMHNKDPRTTRSWYFAVVRGTPLERETERHAFIAQHFEGGVSSLADAIDILEPHIYSELIVLAEDEATAWRKEVLKHQQPKPSRAGTRA